MQFYNDYAAVTEGHLIVEELLLQLDNHREAMRKNYNFGKILNFILMSYQSPFFDKLGIFLKW